MTPAETILALAGGVGGLGAAGAQPTSWTPLGVVTTPGPIAPWAYALFQAGRGSGSDITAQWESIAYTVTP